MSFVDVVRAVLCVYGAACTVGGLMMLVGVAGLRALDGPINFPRGRLDRGRLLRVAVIGAATSFLVGDWFMMLGVLGIVIGVGEMMAAEEMARREQLARMGRRR